MSNLKRSGIQLATPFSESRLLNQGRFRTQWTPPYLIQPKLNGERCRAIVENGRCLLLSSTDQIISTVKHINQQMLHLPNGEYDGELYVHGWTFSEIHSVVSSTVTAHPRYADMQYHIFDLVNSNPQLERVNECQRLSIITTDNVKFVKSNICFTHQDIMNWYDHYISEGYEGFILRECMSPYLRRRSQQMMKFKPKETDTYKILVPLEAISESGTRLGMIGAFMCVDEMGTSFKVGAGKLSHRDRKNLWQMWNDSPFAQWNLKIEYQVLSDKNKVPLFSRACEVII